MRLFFTFLCVFLSIGYSFSQSCLPNGITLTTQGQIDSFAINYPGCTEILGNLYTEEESPGAITNFNGLSPITKIDGALLIYDNEALTNLSGLDNLTSAGSVDIVTNPSLMNLQGLNNLTTLTQGRLYLAGNYNLIDVLDLEKLESISGSLRLDGNTSLASLNGLENLNHIGGWLNIVFGNDSLKSLKPLSNVEAFYSTVYVLGNASLTTCDIPALCTKIANNDGSIVDVYGNGLGCNTPLEVLADCADLGKILNTVFYDINQNKIQDNDEPNYTDARVHVEPNNVDYLSNKIIYLQPGDYTMTYIEADNPDWELTTDSISYSFSLEESGCSNVFYGLYPNVQNSDIQTFITSTYVRCHQWVTFSVTTKNIGTTIASGTTWFQMDTVITDYSFIDEPDVVNNYVEPVVYGWNFTNLYPSQSITRQISVEIPGPPNFAVGDFLHFFSVAGYNDVNDTHSSQGFNYEPEVFCSYDPNDKLVNPSRPYDEVLFGEDFIYTIRFQNTGNDVAYDVTIRDTLDTNLDWETFRVLGSSHSEVLNTSLDNEGILTFDFPNIFLPDSTSNLEGSNGHVTYMISALDGLAENTIINNSAGIYFDQNPPIITNTTESVMVSMLTSTTTPEDLFPDLTILPNPNTGTFQVEGIPRGTYNLLNTKGQIIQSGQVESGTLIDISASAQGVYFIQMMIDEQMVTRRVVKL